MVKLYVIFKNINTDAKSLVRREREGRGRERERKNTNYQNQELKKRYF